MEQVSFLWYSVHSIEGGGSAGNLRRMDQTGMGADQREGEERRMTEREIAEYTESFFNTYGYYLVKEQTRIFRKRMKDGVEGKDERGLDITGGNGNEEIKGIKSFLTRDNDHNEKGGTISFEIFHSWPTQYNDLKLEDLYAGWLLSQYHPEEYCELKDLKGQHKKAVKPGIVPFMLLDPTERIFSSVVFEDVPALLERLKTLCPDPDGWGINELDKLRPASDREYWNKWDAFPNGRKNEGYWDQDHGGMIYNMWHVPLKSLYNLATVTIIKPDVDITKLNELGQKRLSALQWCAKDRIFNPAEAEIPREGISMVSREVLNREDGKIHLTTSAMETREKLEALPGATRLPNGKIRLEYHGTVFEIDPAETPISHMVKMEK